MPTLTIISYAQNLEDVVLWRALGHIQRGFYIDVGACSPDEMSVTRLFSERGWRGVNVEPNPVHHEALEARRIHDVNLPIALGASEGRMEIHLFGDTGLSTLDDAIASEHRKDFAHTTRMVAVRRLADMWREHVPSDQAVHFLKIDVEGFEREVLLGADWAHQRPWVVVVEATAPLRQELRHQAWETILLEADYKFVYFDGLNRFYVAQEHAELETAFDAPPNIFDDFVPVGVVQRDAALNQAQATIDAKTIEATARLAELKQAGATIDAKTAEIEAIRGELSQAMARMADLDTRLARSASEHEVTERLRAEIAHLHQASAQMTARIEQSTGELRRLGRDNASLTAHAETLNRERHRLLSSTSWTVTEPLRQLAESITPARKDHIRRAAKAAWWAVTPWRIPARLRFIRDRNAALAAASAAAPTGYGPDASDENGAFYLEWARSSAPRESVTALATDSISFLVNAGDASDDLALGRTIASLRGQKQENWDAVIFGVDADRRQRPSFAALLSGTPRIVVAEQTQGAQGFAQAFELARGEFVAVLDAGDLLAPAALTEVAATLAENPGVIDILYSDEDQRSERNVREQPYLKPGWSPDLLYAFNYFGRLTLLRRELVRQAEGFDDSAGATVEWDLNLRVADAAQTVVRIPKILCHRRPEGEGDSGAANRPSPETPAAADARRTIEAYWRRHGFAATAQTQPDGTQAVSWPFPREPRVSVIIPTKDKAHLLRMSTTGLLHHTDYRNLELIIVDTGSQEKDTLALYDELRADPRVRIVNFLPKFNYSAACNFGAASATGEMLLFLNNDVEVISPGWLAEMVRFAQRPGVGCVGVKLIFPSLELQHGGVALGPHLAALAYRSEEAMGFGLFGSPHHPRNWMAVMGACQMVTREAFDTVGGFNEAYQIAMSDVALCMQLWRAGYRTAYTPAGALVHHEGATRGHTNPAEDLRRLADDIRAVGIDEDPYLHPGLDGGDPTPRLGRPGGEGPGEALSRTISEVGSYEPVPAELDLAHEGRVMALVERPRAQTLWSPQPACKVADAWSAARWTLDLLRRRPDIRSRFPRALSDGVDGEFARWLATESNSLFGLPEGAQEAFRGMFEADIGARARRLFLWRDDLRRLWPGGLLPIGSRDLFRWFIQHGRTEDDLRLEEIWWLFREAEERPERELMIALCLTPAWQTMFPDAATPFGADRFARWFAAAHRVEANWLDPMCWPFPGTPAEQIRLAWRMRQDWRSAHPDALKEIGAARAFLGWLGSGAIPLEPWVVAWLASLEPEAIAAELARPGINIIGHFCYPSGLRNSVEAMVDGLRENGIEVSLRDVRTDRKDDPGHERYVGFETHDVTVLHMQPEPFLDTVFERIDLAERVPRSYRIGYWYWEFDTIPDSWRRQAALLDEVWAATEFVAKGLRDKLSIPVRTLFPGVRLPPFESRGRAYFGLAEDETLFLFTFHMMSIMERKNPLGLVRAFKRAFGPDEPARLVLKISFGDRHPEQIEKLREAAKGARITIIDELYSSTDVLALMETCDAYVSLHRSEGLGLTMAEAMLMGKPVVATGYSGNTAFMDADNSLLVDYRLVKLGEPIPPYDADYEWAEPSEEDAARLMRRLYDEPDFARALGARAKVDAERRVSIAAAGRHIAIRLAEIEAARSGAGTSI